MKPNHLSPSQVYIKGPHGAVLYVRLKAFEKKQLRNSTSFPNVSLKDFIEEDYLKNGDGWKINV